MSRPRVVALELSDFERGILRAAFLMQAQQVEPERAREAEALDALAERLDTAWQAAAGRRRHYAAGEGRKGGA
jgi:hypothetical protein